MSLWRPISQETIDNLIAAKPTATYLIIVDDAIVAYDSKDEYVEELKRLMHEQNWDSGMEDNA